MKKLIGATTAHNATKKIFEAEFQRLMSGKPSEDMDAFWAMVDELSKRVEQYKGSNNDMIRRAADNAIWDILNDGDWSMASWELAAALVTTYQKVVSELYKKCFEVVSMGDDSYGDWVDVLPLAGRSIIEKILEGDLASFETIDNAIEEHCPEIKDVIQHGENYVIMNLEKVLSRQLQNIVQQMTGDGEEL